MIEKLFTDVDPKEVAAIAKQHAEDRHRGLTATVTEYDIDCAVSCLNCVGERLNQAISERKVEASEDVLRSLNVVAAQAVEDTLLAYPMCDPRLFKGLRVIFKDQGAVLSIVPSVFMERAIDVKLRRERGTQGLIRPS